MSEAKAESTNKRARGEDAKDVSEAPADGEYLLLTCVMYSFNEGNFKQVYKPSLHVSEESLWKDFRSQLVNFLKVDWEMEDEVIEENLKNMKDTQAWLLELDVENDCRLYYELAKVSVSKVEAKSE